MDKMGRVAAEEGSEGCDLHCEAFAGNPTGNSHNPILKGLKRVWVVDIVGSSITSRPAAYQLGEVYSIRLLLSLKSTDIYIAVCRMGGICL